MKNVYYRLKKECTKSCNKKYISYGVEIIENGVQTQYVSNVFAQKRYAKKLVHACNKYDVDPIHIYDVIENMSWEIKNPAKHSFF